ncbi:MAG: class I SAM-dependent methyltransferase [Desulfuromonadales bacterium]|nr:class I SAM-dependent methyltransferase [Desulfuromonadales bacterium]
MKNLRAMLQAALYDRMMRRTERLCLTRWRRELLTPLRGEVLEIGSGTGINLDYYPPQLSRLVLSEPDPHMRRKLEQRVASSPGRQVEVLGGHSERLDLPDCGFDHVVSTLVLCSVADVEQTLAEIKRVMRPGGSLVLLEHVGADDPALQRLQTRLEPAWKWLAGNCHLTRPTAQLLQLAGFRLDLERVEMSGAPRFVRPVIKGVALRS